MFAKWIFMVAVVFNPGATDLPKLNQVTPETSEVTGRFEIYETAYRQPCAPGAEVCPGIIFVARQRFVFCTSPGVYTFTLRLGLIAQEPAAGHIMLGLPDGSEELLAPFQAAPGAPAYVGASLQAQSLTYDACYRIRVETTRPVEVIADPRVSFVTIGR